MVETLRRMGLKWPQKVAGPRRVTSSPTCYPARGLHLFQCFKCDLVRLVGLAG
jgi:hypothetical protein